MSSPHPLRGKPLVEVIFECRWRLEESGGIQGLKRDPNYKFLLGILFDVVKGDYPEHEELPSTTIPDEMVPHIVQHRFRARKGGWPLLQLGPGILTVNDTENYEWDTFERIANKAISDLIKSHPAGERLLFESLSLRFLNAIALDFEKTSVLEFLDQMMRTNLLVPEEILNDSQIDRRPKSVNSEIVFPAKSPAGSLALAFRTGLKNREKVLVLDLSITSSGPEVPESPDNFGTWLADAHLLIERTFFELIKGELERRFSGGA